MTTIAVNLVEGTASSDSRLNGEGTVPMLCSKMWVTKQGDLFVESGDAPATRLALKWAEHRFAEKHLPDELLSHMDKPDTEFSCLLICTDGRVFHVDDGLSPDEVWDDVFTLGSGAEYARGAIDQGATTAQAVEIAIRYDSNSGPPVRTTLLPFKRKGPTS